MSQYRQSQCELMLQALDASCGVGLTRREFAEVLGIKKSNHLVGLIEELMSRNLVFMEHSIDRHNRPCFRYKLIETIN